MRWPRPWASSNGVVMCADGSSGSVAPRECSVHWLLDPLQQTIDSGASRTTIMAPRRPIRAWGGGHRCPPTPRGPSTRAHTSKYTRALQPSSTFPCRRKAMHHRSNHAHFAVFSPVQFVISLAECTCIVPWQLRLAEQKFRYISKQQHHPPKKRPCSSIAHTVSCRAMASPLWSFWHRRCVRLH